MNKLAAVGIFVGGAAVGSLATFYISREYFRKCADDEIAAMRELYSKRKNEEEYESLYPKEVPCETPEELRDYYIKQIRDLGFDIHTEVNEEEIEDDIEEVNPVEYPSTIEQVDEKEYFKCADYYDEYESTSLTLYLKDPTLVDEVDDPINDPQRYIGMGFDDLKKLEAGKTYYFLNHPMMLKIEVDAIDKSYGE